jgi:hypothetical protein
MLFVGIFCCMAWPIFTYSGVSSGGGGEGTMTRITYHHLEDMAPTKWEVVVFWLPCAYEPIFKMHKIKFKMSKKIETKF